MYYAGGNYNYTQMDGSTRPLLLVDLRAALLACDWTEDRSIGARAVLTFTGVPSNNQTVTIDGTVYTFKTALTPAANEVLIGGSASACASNLFDAITDNSANEGTTYGTGTTAHSTCTATVNSGAVTVTYSTGGSTGNGVAVSETLSNAAWDVAQLRYGGYVMTSGLTTQGMQIKVQIDEDNATYVRIKVMDYTETASSQNYILGVSTSRLLEFVGCKFGFHIFLIGTSTTSTVTFHCGVPRLLDDLAPHKVSSIANNGSGLIRVTTAAAHGLTTADHVYLSRGTKNSGTIMTALNGDHVVTVINSTTYDLDGSTYEAGYDADSAYGASVSQVSRAYFVSGHIDGNLKQTWRQTLAQQAAAGSNTSQSVCMNQYWYDYNAGNTNFIDNVSIATIRNPASSSNGGVQKALGSKALFFEPLIGWMVTSGSSQFYWIGFMYNALVIHDDIDMDVTVSNFDGHNWINLTNNSNGGSLVLVTGAVA